MSWNIKVIRRSIKLTENLPPAMGELNSAGFLIEGAEREKNNLKSTPPAINQLSGHLGYE